MLHFFDLGEDLPLHIRDNNLGCKIDNLGCDRDVKHLVADSGRVDMECLGSDRLFAKGNNFRSSVPETEERSQDYITKGNVDEGGKYECHIRSHKVKYKLLLNECSGMSWNKKSAISSHERMNEDLTVNCLIVLSRS